MSVIDTEHERELPAPSPTTTEKLWIIVVVAFAAVLVGAAGALVAFVFLHSEAKPDIILSLFTSAVGFLAGLFVPSPVEGRK